MIKEFALNSGYVPHGSLTINSEVRITDIHDIVLPCTLSGK